MSEAEEEHARQIYQAFRNELGEEGRHMGESELTAGGRRLPQAERDNFTDVKPMEAGGMLTN